MKFSFVNTITCCLGFVEILKLNVGESSWFTSVEIDRDMDIANMTIFSEMGFDFIRSHSFVDWTNIQ